MTRADQIKNAKSLGGLLKSAQSLIELAESLERDEHLIDSYEKSLVELSMKKTLAEAEAVKAREASAAEVRSLSEKVADAKLEHQKALSLLQADYAAKAEALVAQHQEAVSAADDEMAQKKQKLHTLSSDIAEAETTLASVKAELSAIIAKAQR